MPSRSKPDRTGTRPGGIRPRRLGVTAATGLIALGLAGGVSTAAASAKKKGFAVKLKGGSITIAFTAKTWSAINSGSATVGSHASAIAPATENGTGSFTFPISKGTLNSLTGRGTVSATGGLMNETHLSLAGLFESSSSATATAPAISIATSGGKLSMNSPNASPPNLTLFTLNLKHAKVTGSRHAVTITKIPALLTAGGAPFFLSSVLKAGEQVATVTIQAKG